MIREFSKNELNKLNAVHGKFACFVEPNAQCPVCGARVFFYCNENGSRVFFDDLGPPWPKHPCTDNKKPVNEVQRQPSRRPRGRVLDIKEHWESAGGSRFWRSDYTQSDIDRIASVVRLDKNDSIVEVSLEFIDTENNDIFSFFMSDLQPIPDLDTVLILSENEISWFSITTFLVENETIYDSPKNVKFDRNYERHKFNDFFSPSDDRLRIAPFRKSRIPKWKPPKRRKRKK